eukprot:COSAG01_NODE_52283_length_347_cov_4.733871_1_plen_80_part_10
MRAAGCVGSVAAALRARQAARPPHTHRSPFQTDLTFCLFSADLGPSRQITQAKNWVADRPEYRTINYHRELCKGCYDTAI